MKNVLKFHIMMDTNNPYKLPRTSLRLFLKKFLKHKMNMCAAYLDFNKALKECIKQ